MLAQKTLRGRYSGPVPYHCQTVKVLSQIALFVERRKYEGALGLLDPVFQKGALQAPLKNV